MKFKDPTTWVKKKKDLRKHRRQRVKRGWSEYDFWSFHTYHSWMMTQVLERFKTGMGYPGHLTSEEWNDILDEMIEGFQAEIILTDMIGYESGPYDEWEAPYRAKRDRALELFVEYYSHLWE